MSDAVIVGLISATCTIVVQVIVSAAKYRETNIAIVKHEQAQQDMLDDVNRQLIEVKKRLDSHNGYAEKFASAQKDLAVTQKDVEYIKDQLKNIQMCRIK